MNWTNWIFAFVILLGLLLTTVHGQSEAYYADFERADKLHQNWSIVRRNVSVDRTRTFLGEFSNETVSLTIDRLPDHRFLRIRLDLLVLRNWAGSEHGVGPDLWQFSVDDGPLLVDASFSLFPELDGLTQSFPANYPLGEAPANTAASETNSMGFRYDSNKYGVRDAVYRLDYVFPHNTERVVLYFSGLGERIRPARGNARSGTWGLDNVVIETLDNRTVSRLDARQLNQAWEDLALADSVRGNQAVWKLINTGDHAVELLRNKLSVDWSSNANEPGSLILNLNDDDYRIREAATRKLIPLAGVLPQLITRLEHEIKTSRSDEQRIRLARVLRAAASAESRRTPEFRQLARARYILDLTGTEEAAKLHSKLFAIDQRLQDD